MTCYYLAGIHIQTELALSLPVTALPLQGAEVSLVEGSILTAEEGPKEIGWDWSIPSRVTVSYPGLGIASIIDGREIHLRPCGKGAEWRGLILPVFAALMYQRGTLCLHGSAVCRDGVTLGFLGECGAGKSTLVAQLTSAGWGFVSDDLLFLGRNASGGIEVYPGFSLLKLRDDSALAAGEHLLRMGRLYPDAIKDGFSPEAMELEPLALHALYLLEAGEEVSARELPVTEALLALIENAYGARVFEGQPPTEHFRQWGEIATNVPLFRFMRPKDFSRAGETRDYLESMRLGFGRGLSTNPLVERLTVPGVS